ncbi:unnamed protein product [Dibothriocephalus latus]|uniref:Uncharacterized protein n=1 Tax=Dibothriocephalus latus TaxID=60516 RepID=A0A3P7LB04_DIBLA|nr:unnamed protein product [Dibothriocephalus latus]
MAACIVTPFVGGVLCSSIVKRNMEWAQGLKRSSMTPPAWVFRPMWTILYVLLGVASHMVIKEADQQDLRLLLAVYGVNLLLNWLWTPVFFKLHRLKTASSSISFSFSAAIIFVTMLSAVGCCALFHKVNPTAGLLLLPYVIWLILACVFSVRTAALNPCLLPKEAP